MSNPKSLTPRIEKIRAALKTLGPSTVPAIASATGISEKEVGNLIRTARKKEFPGMRFRKAGKTRDGCINMSWIYELSDEPDVVVAPLRYQPSRRNSIKHPGLSREEIVEAKRRREILQSIKPFRDPMVWALFGGQAA